MPERYHLKFVFSNDQFYDPLLAFSGWHRLQRLENGIMVWERADIPPLPDVLPRKEIPLYQRAMWGLVPPSALVLALVAVGALLWHERQHPPQRNAAGACRWRWLDHHMLAWSRLPPDDDGPGIEWQIWRRWLRRLPRLRPAPRTVQLLRSGGLLLVGSIAVVGVGVAATQQARTPQAVVQAYYDDLDFRRFGAAYARLDPQRRPTFEDYLLAQTSQGGLVASYGKLDSVRTRLLSRAAGQVVVQADTRWLTALAVYPSRREHTLVQRDGRWYIVPAAADIAPPPDQFFRQGGVTWHAQQPPPAPSAAHPTTAAIDRPTLAVRSARLVYANGRYGVVGELRNTDMYPADVTVTATLFDAQGAELTRYNAQTVMRHKLLPQESTPFRIDFEGVAGAALTDADDTGTFVPGAFTPPTLERPIASFAVVARAVTTEHAPGRSIAAQHMQARYTEGQVMLHGELLNNGTTEATIPQLLLAYYDAQGRVAWVEEHFIEHAIAPQQGVPFRVALTPRHTITTALERGSLAPAGTDAASSLGLLPLPAATGFAALRVSVNTYEAGQ
jgi:hypothetical protein